MQIQQLAGDDVLLNNNSVSTQHSQKHADDAYPRDDTENGTKIANNFDLFGWIGVKSRNIDCSYQEGLTCD